MRTLPRRPDPRRARATHRSRLVIGLAAALSLVIAGCGTGTDDAAGSPDGSATSGASGAPTGDAPAVEIAGADLILTADDERATLATLDDGDLLLAEVRPGDRGDGAVTVLALARVEGRYELRYVTRGPDGTTDLYGFPARLQVDPRTAEVVDVPTVPVWAPDGSRLAWLEWGTDGTRLRTVGWIDHDAGTNPSDDQATYRLDEVPAGSQLEGWEVDDDGTAVLLVRTDQGERWRLRLEPDGPSLDGATV